MNTRHIILSGLLCATSFAYANKNFVYQSNPIDPACIEKLTHSEGKNKHIELSQCTPIQKDKYLVEQHGYLARLAPNREGGLTRPFFQYKVITQNKDQYVLESLESGGGTGFFSAVFVVSLNKNKLSLVESLAFGDRCNNGISDVKAKAGVVTFAANLTPPDILEMAKDVKVKVTPYQDLEASAASCFGLAYFSYLIKDQKLSLDYVALNEDLHPIEKDSEYKYQNCFNKQANALIKAGEIKLDPRALNQFAKTFLQNCIKK